MNPFRILRDHLITSGVLFTDKQMADVVADTYREIKDLKEDLDEMDGNVRRVDDNHHKLHKEIVDCRRYQREFEMEFRDFEEEYHKLVRYCLRLEKRLINTEKLLVTLTNEPTQEIEDD